MGFENEKTEDGTWQTIDKNKDLALVYLGRSGGNDPYKFELHYGHDIVKLSAYCLIKSNKPYGNDIVWQITKIFIPQCLAHQKQDITHFISEAFNVCGFMFSRKNVSSVTTQFLDVP